MGRSKVHNFFEMRQILDIQKKSLYNKRNNTSLNKQKFYIISYFLYNNTQ